VLFGQLDELGRLPGIKGQRLFREDLFAGQNGPAVDLEMDVVGRAVVNDVDLPVSDELVGSRVDLGYVQFFRRPARQFQVFVGHRQDFDPDDAAEHFQVDQADIASSDQTDSYAFHPFLLIGPA